jgi:hypothetical protein
MAYVIGGKRHSPVGLLGNCVGYHDDARLKLTPGEDMRRRVTRWVRSIILHTTKGIPVVEVQGVGPSTNLPIRIAKLWSTDHRQAGAHLSVDSDLAICCHADLLEDAAYHAGVINEVSIGIEIYQDSNGVVYSSQMKVVAKLVIWLCDYFRIPKQCPEPTMTGVIKRAAQGGSNLCGVFGHRHVGGRGQGDPGDQVFQHLIDRGFVTFDFNREKDIKFWKRLQKEVGIKADGIPGPVTMDSDVIRTTELPRLVGKY